MVQQEDWYHTAVTCHVITSMLASDYQGRIEDFHPHVSAADEDEPAAGMSDEEVAAYLPKKLTDEEKVERRKEFFRGKN